MVIFSKQGLCRIEVLLSFGNELVSEAFRAVDVVYVETIISAARWGKTVCRS